MAFENSIFDIETNGLLPTASVMWIIHFVCVDTKQTREWLVGEQGWKEFIEANIKKLIGHNIVGFDIQIFEKLFGYKLPKHIVVVDTIILSRVLNYRRFGMDGHSLERWGEFFGQPKQEHEDWTQLSPEMITRCQSDCQLNLRVYQYLREELLDKLARQKTSQTDPKLFITYLDIEHAVSKWCGDCEREGWPFNVPKALALKEILREEVHKAELALSQKLGTKAVATDLVKGIVETKRPKWTKDGFYDAHTCKWFDIPKFVGHPEEAQPIIGEYCRVEFVPLKLSSVTDVKIFLYRHGWEPTEWNYKIEEGDDGRNRRVKTTPKITDDSLEFLGGDGVLYSNYVVAKSRLAILETWLGAVDSNGNLHGECLPIGTPSMRATHKIIVNVPSAESAYGREMRELFECEPGWVLIGCDSASNQARGLAHFLNDPVFTDTLINGDIHTFNAELIDSILKRMGIDWGAELIRMGVKPDKDQTMEQAIKKNKRARAKRILYAFLFGASGGKLWSYLFGKTNTKKGAEFKTGFVNAVPGFKALLEKLEKIYGATSRGGNYGYIPSIAGVRVYVDSFHKLLVYLLQSTEKATCGAAVLLLVKALEAKQIPYKPSIFMHDEVQFRVPVEYAEEARQLGKEAFKEGPKLLNVNIMDGDARVGHNWFDTH